jgi:predicted nucleotidyltransferase
VRPDHLVSLKDEDPFTPVLYLGTVTASEQTSPEVPRYGGQLVRPPRDDAQLGEITRRLIDAYRPELIFLFGSRARGDGGPDSDYDLLVVVSDSAPPGRRESRLAYEVLWGAGRAGDVVVVTRGYFEGRAHLRASLPGTVLREGKLLYAG